VRRLDHVVLHVGAEAVLRAEDRAEVTPSAAARRSTMCANPRSTDA
jgi:hypothetical protein